jgi:trimeric autotransporter adhesin
LGTNLNGTEVLLGDKPLPLLYASAGQINAQIPYDLVVNTPHNLVVGRNVAQSVPVVLTVAPAQPAIFTVNQQGTGQGAIMKSDQVTLAQPGTPARTGEAVVIYCAGLGAVTPAVKEGAPRPPPVPRRWRQPSIRWK